jgi:tRNA-dihydrouridine synthase
LAGTGRIPPPPTGDALVALIREHYEGMLMHYGMAVGLRAARKHLGWYLEGTDAPPALRGSMLTESRPEAVMALIGSAFSAAPLRSAA